MPGNAALDAVAAEIAKLRSSYLDGLPGEFSVLAELAGRLKGGDADRPVIDDLHRRLHKLAGSGGTFGLDRLSEHARHLEHIANIWLADGMAAVDAATLHAFCTGIAALPASLDKQDVGATAVTPAAIPAFAASKDHQIWLVDEDETLGSEIRQLLQQFGYHVRVFSRVADVAAAAASSRPDVLVMDVICPQQGTNAVEPLPGMTVLRALGCPMLFISANGDFCSRVQAARAGVAGFLLKPLDVPRLVDRLERIFDDRIAPPYRVMIVDDDITLAEHYRLVLTAAGMEVRVLNQPTEVIDSVAAFRPELILMDMHMPDYSGPELATVIRQHEEWIGMSIVYLSAETDLDEQIKALGHGADDFLTKPISDARLAAAVRARVIRSRQLAELMSKDSLTGLLKHSRIKEELDIELARARRNGSQMSVVMADIDHFKQVNDTYGHAIGDRIIKAVSQLLRQRLRQTDSIGRYGGEEFAIVLPECDAATAFGIIDDIRQRFATLRFHFDTADFCCTLSAGIACSSASANHVGSELLVAADAALYAAKHDGRNLVRIAESTS